jgi:uncharacterized protein (TIGR04255 family)
MVGKYKNPPLVESVCEFTFSDELNWDSTIVGRFYDQIKEFPIKHTKTKPICDGIEEDSEECPNFKKQEYTVFSNKEKIFDIGITERKLVVRALKPYSDWGIYKKVITDCYSKLNAIINARNCSIKFYYVNIIKPKDKGKFTSENILNYFHFAPINSSANLPKEWDDFIVGYTHKYTSDNSFFRTSLASIADKKKQEYYLGITLTTLKPIKSSDIPKWMDKSHEKIDNAFEGCITDKLRNIFVSGE